MRTFGVEEELLIVDPETGMLLALADVMLPSLVPPKQDAALVLPGQQPVHDGGADFS